MSLYRPPSINEEPNVILSSWAVYRITWKMPNKTEISDHFVGFNSNSQDGRVSSPIVKYDNETCLGASRSGRIYELKGNSGYNQDAMYVWQKWKDINYRYMHSVEDVSLEYEKRI